MKKGMKKILSAAIVLAMTMSLAACGGGNKGNTGTGFLGNRCSIR